MAISTQALEYIYQFEFIQPFVRAGFNFYAPAWDTGVDFILVKEFRPALGIPDIIVKVQLKSRWTIKEKYIGRKIWIAFPDGPLDLSDNKNSSAKPRGWYLMPHDLMVRQAMADHGMSESFAEGHYSKKSPPKSFAQLNFAYSASNVLGHIAEHNSVTALDVEGCREWPRIGRE